MTVLGISGCTALIVTGFGVKDSIEMIVTGQYGRLFKYDMSIVTDSDINDKELSELGKIYLALMKLKNMIYLAIKMVI